MGNAYIFYNPLAGDGKILEDLDALEFVLDDPCVLCDMTRPATYCEALFAMEPEDYLVVCGGDGTLNRFVNLTGDLQRANAIYYYPAGKRNNFARTWGRRYGCNPFAVTDCLRALPSVSFKHKSERFLTEILFDATAQKRRIFKRGKGDTGAKTVTVSADGEIGQYTRVQLLAVIHGANSGKRGEGPLSLVLISGCGRWKAKRLLNQLHRKKLPHSACCLCLRADALHITFDGPVCLRVDGELQNDVAEFSATGI